ncbi:MAG: hypothetical protein Q9178_005417 [Gyalolechia marmorata]
MIRLSGRRYLHLVHCIYAPREGGNFAHRKLKNLAWYKLRDASEDKLQLVDNNGSGQMLSLIEVQKRLEPGQFLERLDKGPNCEPTYRISHITPTVEGARNASGEVSDGRSIKFTRAGRGKEMHLNSRLHVERYRHILKTSMKHINDGCRVEMHVNVAKGERKDKDLNTVMAENPHLRPDVILRSMPKGTEMAYEPLFLPASLTGGQLIWVMNDDRKWSEQRGSTGWRGSPSTPPTQAAKAILKRLPVVRSASEHVMGLPDTEQTHKETAS